MLMMLTRYQAMLTFGRGTIRKFNSNASSMKHLAARDFEDLLQVSTHLNIVSTVLIMDIYSAHFQSLRTYCPSDIIRSY